MPNKIMNALFEIDQIIPHSLPAEALERNPAIAAVLEGNPSLPGHALTGFSMTQDICHHLAVKSGWWKDVDTGEDLTSWPKKYFDLLVSTKLMLSVTELAEAMEGHRKGLMDDHLPHRQMLEVEMADCVIRLLDLGGALKMDIAGAIIEKLAYNQQRADHKIENRAAAGGKAL